MKMNAWVSSIRYLPELAATKTDEQRIGKVVFVNPSVNMSREGWVLVGTAEVDLRLDQSGAIQAGAVAAVDMAIENTRHDFSARIKELQEARASLLALPASVEVAA